MDKKNKKENYLENWKRERAAFLNYKKDESERIEKAIKFSNQVFIVNILNILDNIYLAEKKRPEELKDNKWAEGTLKIKEQMLGFLRNNGVEEIDCLDKKFDPRFHEAVKMADSDSDSGAILEEISKGYLLHGKVIRASRVKIAK